PRPAIARPKELRRRESVRTPAPARHAGLLSSERARPRAPGSAGPTAHPSSAAPRSPPGAGRRAQARAASPSEDNGPSTIQLRRVPFDAPGGITARTTAGLRRLPPAAHYGRGRRDDAA